MSTWTIYGLRAPGGTIRYVGMTTNAHERRLQHLSKARKSQTTLHAWIREVGRELEIVALERGEGNGWPDVERKWIAALPDLLNTNSGGTAPAVTPTGRRRAAEKLKTRVFTAEHRRRISEAKRGLKRPDMAERNRALGLRLRGRKMNLSAEERARRSKSIPDPHKYWRSISPEELARRSAMASAQMKRVWAQRKAGIR